MSRDNCLQRAHQLSAEASLLVRPPDADAATLSRALKAYQEAADLFDEANREADDGTRPTLRMLTTQHRKLARDLERRMSTGRRTPITASPLPSPTTAALESPFVDASPSRPSRESTPVPSRPALSPRSTASPSVGLAAGRGGPLGGAGLAVHATSARSVPPFSMRPVAGANDGNVVNPPPPPPFAAPGSPRSPLYSSSSSSDPPDESYFLPGAVPDTGDPFSRFWGMLENKLEEISFPKALTMPFDHVSQAGPSRQANPQPSKVTKDKRRSSDKPRSPSPSESFYVVPRGHDKTEKPQAVPARKSSPAGKTPEELALENESLRASLDALAVHAHSLEVANRTLTERATEHEKVVRSVVHGVRREAYKARQEQEVFRSQMLASSTLPTHRADGNQQLQQAMRKRVAELEEEVAHLREDNQKLNVQLDKFKEKWEKLKAKKEAKVAAAKGRAPRTPDK